MNTFRSIVAGAALLALPAEAQVHRFETDPVVTVDTPESVVQIISPYVSGRAQGGRGLGK